MNERDVLVNRLLDKYEKSAHLLTPGRSTRRVLLNVEKKDIPEYDYEYAPVRDAFNAAAKALEEQQLVCIEWADNRMVMQKIVLELQNVRACYRAVGRVHPGERAERVIEQTERYLKEARTPWLAAWRDRVIADAQQKLSVPQFCREDEGRLCDLLRAFQGYDALRDTISMRTFSIDIYHDSKYFERSVRGTFLGVARKYCAELAALCEEHPLSERDQLAFLGIYARPEHYEMSGSFAVHTEKGIIDFRAAEPFGLALPGTLVDRITAIDADEIDTLTFIENKTNYDEYLCSEKGKREIAVYHGGFLSPKKKKLVRRLCEAVPESVEIRFWADIDLGGFRMFEQLHEVAPQLQPMRMGADEVERYHEYGLPRTKAYLDRLRAALDAGDFPQFSDAAQKILLYGVTIEQEIFLAENAAQ